MEFFALAAHPLLKMKSNNERLIFVTNDDGYQARGFTALIELAREFGNVIAVAPATPQSGRSQAITMGEPLFLDKRCDEPGLEIYSFTGTPVDCVKIAFDHLLLDRKVDLVLSGINHGSNAAINVLYSGTMGAAIEGSFYGAPAIGLSLTDHSPDADFSATVEYGRRIIRSIVERSDEEQRSLCLNVNVPDRPLDEIRGIRVCRQCRGIWREEFFPHENPRGRRYFWLTGDFHNYEAEAADTDTWALENGYVAVVPVQIDMTAYDRLPYLERILK